MWEFIFEFIAEFVFQGLIELGVDLATRSRIPGLRTAANAAVYGFIGAICGAVSLAFFSDPLIQNKLLRTVVCFFLPVVYGLLFSAVGRALASRRRLRGTLEHFVPAFAFSLAFGLVRLLFAGF